MQEGADLITLQHIDLQVVRRGSGPPLLLLHGGGGPQHHLPFFHQLTERFDVIAPIHPGFAGSAIPEHFDGMDDLIYLHLDLMDALDLHDAVVVGMSMGGWAAAEMAVRNTSRMSKLILVDAVGIKAGGRDARDIADVFGLPQDDVTRLLFHDPAAPDPPLPTNKHRDRRQPDCPGHVHLGALYVQRCAPVVSNRCRRCYLGRRRLVSGPYAEAYRDGSPAQSWWFSKAACASSRTA